jgi:hypothetical protein
MKPRMKKLHEQRDIVVDDCLAVEIGDAKKHLRLEIPVFQFPIHG